MFRNPAARVSAFVSSFAALLLMIAADASATGAPGGRAAKKAAAGGGASVVVNGVVKDASQGWPLYATLEITSTEFESTIFTDPVTGYYTVSLPVGATYQFAVTAVSSGYAAGGGPLTLPAAGATAALVANWFLTAGATCTAPGYAAGGFSGLPVLAEGFDAGTLPAGWAVDTASGVAWLIYSAGDPCEQFPGNRTGGTGPYAVLNSGCLSTLNFDDSSLVTPAMDLTAVPAPAVQWASDFVDFDFGTVATVEASIDGGGNWTTVWTAPRPDLPGPGTQLADLSFAGGQPNVKVRFHYQGFFAWWWQVDDIKVGAYACTPLPGGLVVGTVSDANDGAALNGATVSNPPEGGSTTTFPTPLNPEHENGLYILFAESGPQQFAASRASYETVTKNTTVIPGATVLLDFALPAGRFEASPRPLSAAVAAGATQDAVLTLSNTGSSEGSFLIQELNVAPEALPAAAAAPASLTAAGAASRKAALKRVGFAELDVTGTRLPAAPNAPGHVAQIAQAGNVDASFPTGLVAGRGLVYDTTAQRLWVPNPHSDDAGIPGDGLEYQYLPDGTQTGDTIDIHETGGLFPVGGTYNLRTGMLWQVNVGGDLCLFELDPVAKVVTGKKICGPWSSSQRAVAYDYATDTYYVGGTNEATVYHVDASGNLLDTAYIGLGIAGLAYNPTTRHLFVASDFPAPFNIWVADPRAGYTLLGGFTVTSGGVPVLQNGDVSLSADCEGRLWILDPDAQTVYRFGSGESGWCVNDIPWLSEKPGSGTVAAGDTAPVTVRFDTAGLLPGLRLGSLLFATDTPGAVEPLPVDLTVLFGDVPTDSFAANFIYGAAGAGIMPGCAPQTPTFLFCPAEVVTRRTMAGFIERAVHGATTPAPVYLGEFGDVLPGSFNANYIQGLVDDAITAGCGGGNYCPDVPVTRAQMAVFVWKAQHGSEPPPACTPPGTYADVSCPDAFAVDYIEGITFEGITVGCGNGQYCPNASITNAQMAVFLVKAFNIPYLP